jgi:hypothetical protein
MGLTRAQRDYAEADAKAKAFTAANPVGTLVRFWPGVRAGEGRESAIRSDAWALLSGHVIVCVEAYPGGIDIGHVEPIAVPQEGNKR